MNRTKVSVLFTGKKVPVEFDTLQDFIDTYPIYEQLRYKIQEMVSRHKITFVHPDFELSRVRVSLFRLESSIIIAEYIDGKYFPIPQFRGLSDKLTDVFQSSGRYNIPELDGYKFIQTQAQEYPYKYISKNCNERSFPANRMRSIIYLVYQENETKSDEA